jgi:branched-chain amino acid transport system substrate-binding protein
MKNPLSSILRSGASCASILDAAPPPKAVIMIGTYGPSAKFIRILRRVLPECLFLNISFVGSEALAESLGESSTAKA